MKRGGKIEVGGVQRSIGILFLNLKHLLKNTKTYHSSYIRMELACPHNSLTATPKTTTLGIGTEFNVLTRIFLYSVGQQYCLYHNIKQWGNACSCNTLTAALACMKVSIEIECHKSHQKN